MCILTYFVFATMKMLINQNFSEPTANIQPTHIQYVRKHFGDDDVIREKPALLRQEIRNKTRK